MCISTWVSMVIFMSKLVNSMFIEAGEVYFRNFTFKSRKMKRIVLKKKSQGVRQRRTPRKKLPIESLFFINART